MPVSYTTAAKTARMTATKDHFSNGSLVLMTAANAVLATFELTAAAGSVSGDIWTLGFVADTVAGSAVGAAAKAEIRTSAGTANLTGLTVGTSAADIILDNTSIATGQNVTLTSAQIQHA